MGHARECHKAPRSRANRALLSVPMFAILIGTDKRGSFPLLLQHDDEQLATDVRWRLVGHTRDRAEALWLLQAADEYCRGLRAERGESS